MRKFFTHALLLCALSIVLEACGNSESPLSEPSRFSIHSSIQGVTRTPVLDDNGQGRFSAGDENTVFFQDRKGNLLKEMSYIYGNSYYWNDFQLGNTADGLKVSACYPPVKATDAKRFFWDVTSKESLTPDFLIAAPVEATQGVTTEVALTFKHLMHKLIVKLTPDGTTVTAKDLANARISVSQFLPTAIIDLLEATVGESTGTPSQLAQSGTYATFILPPQAAGAIEVTVDVNGRSQTFRLADCKVDNTLLSHLQSGKAFTLAISVSKTSFTITGQDINPWGNQGEANGNIEI